MAKIRILSKQERKAFQSPPVFQTDERPRFFEMSDQFKIYFEGRTNVNKVGFILQLVYFRRTGRFFSPSQFYKPDIIFACELLDIDAKSIEIEKYKEHRVVDDQENILKMLGFRAFDDHENGQLLLSEEITRLVSKQMRPKMIFYYLSNFFFQKKIAMPSYQQVSELIIKSMHDFEDKLLLIIESNISKQQAKDFDQLLPKIDPAKILKKEAYYARAPLVALREFPLSTRPKKIKESVDAFLTIKKLFDSAYALIQSLALSPQSLKYYAVWVQKAKITQLMQISNPNKRYLYLLAFITHHYYHRQDLLGDTLLQSVQRALNIIESKQQEENKNTKKEKDHATNLLSSSHKEKSHLLSNIRSIVNKRELTDEEKIAQIKKILKKDDINDPEITACLEKLDKQVTNALNGDEYYNALEKQSLKMQTRLSPIIKNLNFNVLNSKASLLKAIEHFKLTDGKISSNAPCDFLSQDEQLRVKDDKNSGEKFRVSLYKALLFVSIADAIRSGEINLTHSYRYLSIDEYLINKAIWQNNKNDYLERAELTKYKSIAFVLKSLNKKLNKKYRKLNKSISSGENTYISFNKNGEALVDTPAVTKLETQRVAELLKQENYISILDVLNDIDHITNFNKSLQHYSVVQEIKRPAKTVFYAGLIGKGCNIGTGKLSSVSKGINGNTLDTVVNWYFTNDNIMGANQRVINFINKLALPDVMRRTSGLLHTSSDGQKRNVDLDSVLANFSFKYHGSGRGVSIYDFIDERHVLFHSLVMSSSEREAAYVIDGLMCNDEIKSDIHSTDTHGYSDLIFAITHLLGISFAPRLAKLKKRSLFSIDSKKSYRKKGYSILPDQTIDVKLIENNWDDILRLVATIKLKEATASQILKRLSSYAKDHPLYKGLKEFGKLIKTIFILTYMNDLEFRQSIQKQLNKIELANKFSDAVFFDNNQEFKYGSKEEQEVAMNCKILLQNSIVLWNYLRLSQLLATTESASKRAEFLEIIKNGSIMTWAHINMLGEYDFRSKPASNESIFDIEKILAWSAA